MVAFFGCLMICLVVGCIIAEKRGKNNVDKGNIIVAGIVIGVILGVGASFWGGSNFVKKEIIVEKYVISPMIFNGKPIMALMEGHDNLPFENNNYIFQVVTDEKLKFIKHCLYKKDIFFSLNEGEERRMEIKRSKACGENMWIWFFLHNRIH